MIALSSAHLAQLDIPAPLYDRARLTTGIVHIGVGGFHRAHQAVYLDDLMQRGQATNWGICGIGLLPGDKRMRDALVPQEGLYTVVTRDASGDQARIIGSLTRYLLAPDAPEAVLAALASPAARLVTLTITEGGYTVPDQTEPSVPTTVFDYLVDALHRRRQAGIAPFTVLSCDNIQSNGRAARHSVLACARRRDPSLADWITRNVSFPSCMVDRITPQTTDAERQMVQSEFGVEDAWPVVCEPFRQWVIEDDFVNGRPPLEEVGVQMTTDVHPYELMKIRLLNAGHSAIGYLGWLVGYRYIHEVAADPQFQQFLHRLWDSEVTPLLAPVPGVDLSAYKAALLTRFANPRIADQVARICLDGSSKMPKFLLPSLHEQMERGGPHRLLTLAVAGWLRYLSGTDEQGQPIFIEDPMAAALQESARAGGTDPRPLLAARSVFGSLIDSPRFVAELHSALELLYAEGARATLQQYLT